MGWNAVEPPADSALFASVREQRFYFVHSFAVRSWAGGGEATWATHGDRFVAAVEDGPACATQFHPEKSGDAGAALLANWLGTLR